jgi:hypothetical protein
VDKIKKRAISFDVELRLFKEQPWLIEQHFTGSKVVIGIIIKPSKPNFVREAYQ